MINIYLCEDEEIQRDFVQSMLEMCITEKKIDAKVVSAKKRAEDTLRDATNRRNEKSLFIIDIQLDDSCMNGIDLARKLKEMSDEFYFAFLTSEWTLAYKTFEYQLGVLDYIVKDPSIFMEKKMGSQIMERFERIFKELEKKEQKSEEIITIECGSRRIEVLKENIIYIQALKGRHSIEIVASDRRIITNMSLKSMEERLGNQYIWINKSCLVSKKKMKELDKKTRFLTLENGEVCEVSFRKMNEVWDCFLKK